MKLSEAQRLFTLDVGKLIIWAYEQGFELTFGESYNAEGLGHMKGSCHYIRLAQDFNLFIAGEYQTETFAYLRLGQYWKSLGPFNRWGGDFNHPDGNHFSYLWDGRA